ncbi:MAG: hypothetical protein P4L46_15775 [Fimbriimonas sp.]|nr:hypothetical protein [Fimbriimonas sp.]
MSGAPEVPVCVAIVICNECIEDKRTNNKTLINLFNAINVPSVPSVHQKLVVLASVTNASATIPLQLLVRAPSGGEEARINVDLHAADPLAVYDMVFEINGLVLNQIGPHHIDLLSGTAYLGGRRFDVLLHRPTSA